MLVLTIIDLEGQVHGLEVAPGSNLREVVLQRSYSPYTKITANLNCGGRGICATCGVWIEEGRATPVHWHDKAARHFGYPRLSCQVTLTTDLTIRMVDKWIWGSRRPTSPDS